MSTSDNYWDPHMSSELIKHILLFELFDNMVKNYLPDFSPSPDQFEINSEDTENLFNFDSSLDFEDADLPSNNALIEIIRKHTRLIKVKKGEIVIKKGDYGNSAFFIASGKMAIISPSSNAPLLNKIIPKNKISLLETAKKWWQNPLYPEKVLTSSIDLSKPLSSDKKYQSLDNFQETLEKNELIELNSGELFGVVGPLGRTPRTASVVATMYCELLEIRWQGLRDFINLDQEFKKSIEHLYKRSSMLVHLYNAPLFSSLSKSAIDLIAKDTSFKTYGSFEWQADYKDNLDKDAINKSEILIVEEGDYSDSLYFIRSGFVRVSYKYNNGYQILQYLSHGDTFGLESLAYNWKNKTKLRLQTSIHALGYADILQVPSYIIDRMVFPSMKPKAINELLASERLQSYATHAENSTTRDLNLNDAVLDFMSDYRYINGTSTMLIDTDRCTRCDDCVTACAVGHNNNPRFNRHGHRYDHFMVANACMHCSDPVCMIGCPTGAIQRNPNEGQIVINDSTCIGCSTCANSCPYENIRMVEIRDKDGLVIQNQDTQSPVLKATKCNLCIDQLAGPACERACPHDALKRFNIQDLPEMTGWMNR